MLNNDHGIKSPAGDMNVEETGVLTQASSKDVPKVRRV